MSLYLFSISIDEKGSMRNILLSLLIVVFVGIILNATLVTNLNVRVEGSDVLISWEMIDQSNVSHFNVERRGFNEDEFYRLNKQIIPVNATGRYTYVDRSVFKTEEKILVYRIAVQLTNGTTVYSEPIFLGLDNFTSVRRTWGSIKSMFR